MPDNQDTNSINKFIRKQKGAEKICSGPCSSGRPVCDHEKLVRNVLFCYKTVLELMLRRQPTSVITRRITHTLKYKCGFPLRKGGLLVFPELLDAGAGYVTVPPVTQQPSY